MDATHEEYINAVTKESEKFSMELFNKKASDLTNEELEHIITFLNISVTFILLVNKIAK